MIYFLIYLNLMTDNGLKLILGEVAVVPTTSGGDFLLGAYSFFLRNHISNLLCHHPVAYR